MIKLVSGTVLDVVRVSSPKKDLTIITTEGCLGYEEIEELNKNRGPIKVTVYSDNGGSILEHVITVCVSKLLYSAINEQIAAVRCTFVQSDRLFKI